MGVLSMPPLLKPTLPERYDYGMLCEQVESYILTVVRRTIH